MLRSHEAASCSLTQHGVADGFAEGQSDGHHERTATFQAVVLKWSCSELISNPNMLVNKVRPLKQVYPLGCPGVLEFTTTAFWHLQEEVRAQLQQQVEASADLAWAAVCVDARSASMDQPLGTPGASGLISLTISSEHEEPTWPPATIASQQPTIGGGGGGGDGGSGGGGGGGGSGTSSQRRGAQSNKGPLGCKPTDLVIVSSTPVNDPSVWLQGEVVQSLGLVTGLEQDEEGGGKAPAAKVTLFALKGSAMWVRLGMDGGAPPPMRAQGGSKSAVPQWHMALIGTAATSVRTWEALQSAATAALPGAQGSSNSSGTGQKQLGPLSDILQRVLSPAAGGLLAPLPVLAAGPPHLLPAVASFCNSRGLNPSQANAVQCVVASAAKQSVPATGSDVQLIQGPPGTGKTSTIVTALYVVLGCGKTALMCAPTNVAVQEVATRFLQQLPAAASAAAAAPAASAAASEAAAAANADTGPFFVLSGAPQHAVVRLADVVLLASEDAVADDSPVQAISSKARAARLCQAVGCLRAASSQLSRLVTAPELAYNEFKAQQSNNGDSSSSTSSARRANSSSSSGLQLPPLHTWLQQEFDRTLQLAQDGAAALCQEVPSALLPGDKAAALQQLSTHMLQAAQRLAATPPGVLRQAFVQLCTAQDIASAAAGGGDRSPEAAALVSSLQAAAAAMQRHGSWLPSQLSPLLLTRDVPTHAIEAILLRHARLVFCTVSSSGRPILGRARGVSGEQQPQQQQQRAGQGGMGRQQQGDKEQPPSGFDVCVVDEAGQLVEVETCIILQGFPRLPLLVLVGDHKQLPATVMSQLASKHGYRRSMLERLQLCGVRLHMLDTQYRMHPAISSHPSNAFYGAKLLNGPNVLLAERASHLAALPLFQELGPYRIINIQNSHEEPCAKTSSKLNRFEAEAVRFAVMQLAREYRAQASQPPAGEASGSGSRQLSIGIISPYSAQVQLLIESLQSVIGGAASGGLIGLEIKSVDGFQGREMDVIIVSTVRSNSGRNIGFLKDERRLNVAITRGRHAVWLFSHVHTLRADETWAELLADAERRSLLVSDHDLPVLHPAVRNMERAVKRQADLNDPSNKLFEGLAWKVAFSQEFQHDLIKSCTPNQRAAVIDRLLQLAQGKRPEGWLSGRFAYPQCQERYRHIVNVQRVLSNVLVWTTDVDRTTCRQLLKVWRLVPDALLTVRRLEAAMAVYTDAYLDRCARVHAVGGVVLPDAWAADPSFAWLHTSKPAAQQPGSGPSRQQDTAILEHADVEQSLLLMKFFNLDRGVARLLIQAADPGLELMFNLNVEEERIMRHDKTAFIQGRSGTGKTTVIVALIMMREQASQLLLNGSAQPGDDEQQQPGAHGPSGSTQPDEQQQQQQQQQQPGAQGTSGGGSGTTLGRTGKQQGERLRQLLVTLSPKLCAAMRADLARRQATLRQLSCSATAAGGDTDTEDGNGSQRVVVEEQLLDQETVEAMFGDLPASLSRVLDAACPLVLPLRRLLFMLDAALPQKFKSTIDSSSSTTVEQPPPSDDELSWSDDSNDPSDSSDDESSDDDADNVAQRGPKETGFSQQMRASPTSLPLDSREVSFDVFAARYWPGMDQSKRKGLGAAAWWTQVQSHIKGSKAAVWSTGGYLSREQYIALADTRAGQDLPASQRELVYDLFRAYERTKAQRDEWDLGDLTAHLHRQLRQDGFPEAARFQFVYIDEVQDLTPAQLALFRFLSSRPQDGFVFAGDTAQTIARGVGFRFEDIRELYYTDFLQRGTTAAAGTSQAPARTAADTGFSAAPSSGVSESFQLVQNYRTHVGIVQLADTLVQCLTRLFPNSIDKLQPESSKISGRIPVFVEGQDPLDALLGRDVGSAGLAAGGAGCDFGAEQAVLVRDEACRDALYLQLGAAADTAAQQSDAARANLQQQLLVKHLLDTHAVQQLLPPAAGGTEQRRRREERCVRLGMAIARHLLVMTAAECKGLEFQVVLVHGFFSSSPLGDAWRVMYGYMQQHFPDLFSAQELASGHFTPTTFCPQRHQLLCSELKLLYVMCTRAKHCVLFYEPKPDSARPMMELWCRKGLVERQRMGPEVSSMLVRASTPEEWIKRAKDFFNSQQYARAQMCAERGNDVGLATRCEAEALRQAASLATSASERHELFLRASAKFKLLPGLVLQAVNCLVEAKEHLQAAVTFQALGMHDKAALQYIEAGQVVQASDSWLAGGRPDKALALCFKAMSKEEAGNKEHAALAEQGLRVLRAGQSETAQAHRGVQDARLQPILEAIVMHLAETGAVSTTAAGGAGARAKQALQGLFMEYVGMLGDVSRQRALLKRFDLLEGLLALEVQESNHHAAGELCERLGRPQDALSHYLRSTNNTSRSHDADTSRPPALRLLLRLLRTHTMWAHGKHRDGWPLVVGQREVGWEGQLQQLLGSDWAQSQLQLRPGGDVQPASASRPPGQGVAAGQRARAGVGAGGVHLLLIEAQVLLTLLGRCKLRPAGTNGTIGSGTSGTSGTSDNGTSAAPQLQHMQKLHELQALQASVLQQLPTSVPAWLLTRAAWEELSQTWALIHGQRGDATCTVLAAGTTATGQPGHKAVAAALPTKGPSNKKRNQKKGASGATAPGGALPAPTPAGPSQQQHSNGTMQPATAAIGAATAATAEQVAALSEALLCQWKSAQECVTAITQVATMMAQDRAPTTAADKAVSSAVLAYLACDPLPSRPGCVVLDLPAVWLARKGQLEVSVKEAGKAAGSIFMAWLDTVAKNLVELLYTDLCGAPDAAPPARPSAGAAIAPATVNPPAAGPLQTRLEALPQAPLQAIPTELRCRLLLALEQAARTLTGSSTSAGSSQADGQRLQALQLQARQQLFRTCVAPDSLPHYGTTTRRHSGINADSHKDASTPTKNSTSRNGTAEPSHNGSNPPSHSHTTPPNQNGSTTPSRNGTAPPSSVITTVQAPPLLRLPAVPPQLLKLAEHLSAKRSYLPKHKRYLGEDMWDAQRGSWLPPRLPLEIMYDNLAGLLLLQGCLTVDLLDHLRSPHWSEVAWLSLDQLAPWQQLVISMKSIKHMHTELRNTMSTLDRKGVESPDWQQNLASARHASEYATWAALRASIDMFGMYDFNDFDSQGRPLPVEPGIHPWTLLTLFERICCLATTQHTRLRGTALPLSWALTHLTLPGPTTQLTILIKKGGWSSTEFVAALDRDVPALCSLLVGLLTHRRLLERLFQKAKVALTEQQVGAWQTRALVILAVVAVNMQPAAQQAAARSQAASPKDCLLQACGCPCSFPPAVQAELQRLGATRSVA